MDNQEFSAYILSLPRREQTRVILGHEFWDCFTCRRKNIRFCEQNCSPNCPSSIFKSSAVCAICLEDKLALDLHQSSCGHPLCLNCYRQLMDYDYSQFLATNDSDDSHDSDDSESFQYTSPRTPPPPKQSSIVGFPVPKKAPPPIPSTSHGLPTAVPKKAQPPIPSMSNVLS